MTLKTSLMKASLVQNELQNEILWLTNLKPPEKLKADIDTLIEKRQIMLKQIYEKIETISIDVPAEAETYLPNEEIVEPEPIAEPKEPIGDSKG